MDICYRFFPPLQCTDAHLLDTFLKGASECGFFFLFFFLQKHNRESTKLTRAANKEGGRGARSLFASPLLLFPLGEFQWANKNADHEEDGSGRVWGARGLLAVVPREEGAEGHGDKRAMRM